MTPPSVPPASPLTRSHGGPAAADLQRTHDNRRRFHCCSTDPAAGVQPEHILLSVLAPTSWRPATLTCAAGLRLLASLRGRRHGDPAATPAGRCAQACQPLDATDMAWPYFPHCGRYFSGPEEGYDLWRSCYRVGSGGPHGGEWLDDRVDEQDMRQSGASAGARRPWVQGLGWEGEGGGLSP